MILFQSSPVTIRNNRAIALGVVLKLACLKKEEMLLSYRNCPNQLRVHAVDSFTLFFSSNITPDNAQNEFKENKSNLFSALGNGRKLK